MRRQQDGVTLKQRDPPWCITHFSVRAWPSVQSDAENWDFCSHRWVRVAKPTFTQNKRENKRVDASWQEATDPLKWNRFASLAGCSLSLIAGKEADKRSVAQCEASSSQLIMFPTTTGSYLFCARARKKKKLLWFKKITSWLEEMTLHQGDNHPAETGGDFKDRIQLIGAKSSAGVTEYLPRSTAFKICGLERRRT